MISSDDKKGEEDAENSKLLLLMYSSHAGRCQL